MRTLGRLGLAAAVGMLATVAVVPAASASTPSVDHFTSQDSFYASTLSAECGFDIWRDSSATWTIISFQDGSVQVHGEGVDVFSANGRSVTERDAFTYFFSADGSYTITGADYHAYQPGAGLVVIDAGKVGFDPDGNIVLLDGPHPIVLDGYDRAPTFCPALAP